MPPGSGVVDIPTIWHCERLVTTEGVEWGWDGAVIGAMEQLVPILLTATVTALGDRSQVRAPS